MPVVHTLFKASNDSSYYTSSIIEKNKQKKHPKSAHYAVKSDCYKVNARITFVLLVIFKDKHLINTNSLLLRLGDIE